MKKTLFITTLLLSAGAMFTSCNKDVENPDMQSQPEETAQVTRAYGDKTPLIEVYYEINDTTPLNALSYEMSGKKFIDLVQLFASNIQKDANGDPCIFFNAKSISSAIVRNIARTKTIRSLYPIRTASCCGQGRSKSCWSLPLPFIKTGLSCTATARRVSSRSSVPCLLHSISRSTMSMSRKPGCLTAARRSHLFWIN